MSETAPRRMTMEIDGEIFDEWTTLEVVRDLKEFAGSFSATFREAVRTIRTLPFGSKPPVQQLAKGAAVTIRVDTTVVLKGFIKQVETDIDEASASTSISGLDKAGDLIDCAAAPDGPAEFRSLKLDEVAKRIVKPYGLTLRSEIDTGQAFPRYGLDLTETALSALEKGARQRHALILSDGVGGIVITRTGATRAPATLTVPGNVKRARRSESDEGQHSETIVRGQSEAAAGRRDGRRAALDVTAEPLDPGARNRGDGSATERERRGTALTGRARNEAMRRHRPKVHLTRSQADETSIADEADWRMRSARAGAEDVVYTVHDFRENGALWMVNQLASVSDAYHGIERDMLISQVRLVQDESALETELTLTSPEAFDKAPVGKRREDLPSKRGGTKKATSGGALDTTAEAL